MKDKENIEINEVEVEPETTDQTSEVLVEITEELENENPVTNESDEDDQSKEVLEAEEDIEVEKDIDNEEDVDGEEDIDFLEYQKSLENKETDEDENVDAENEFYYAEKPAKVETKTVKANKTSRNQKTMDDVAKKRSKNKIDDTDLNKPRVITISDAEGGGLSSLENEGYVELTASLKSQRYMTGVLEGVERNAFGPMAITYHKGFKILIPFSEMIDEPLRYGNKNKLNYQEYLLSIRLGSEFEYIITMIDRDEKLATASRKKAMEMKKRSYFFQRPGKRPPIIQEGAIVQARVTATSRSAVYAEVFGVDTRIPLSELSWTRIQDAHTDFKAGQIINVKINNLKVDSDSYEVTFDASAKDATEHPFDTAIKRITENGKYQGIVTQASIHGVFVRLHGMVDCLCKLPQNKGLPLSGQTVTVKVTGINALEKKIFGILQSY